MVLMEAAPWSKAVPREPGVESLSGFVVIASCMHTPYKHPHFLVLKLGVHTHSPGFIGGGSGERRVIPGVDQKAWGAILGTESEA